MKERWSLSQGLPLSLKGHPERHFRVYISPIVKSRQMSEIESLTFAPRNTPKTANIAFDSNIGHLELSLQKCLSGIQCAGEI